MIQNKIKNKNKNNRMNKYKIKINNKITMFCKKVKVIIQNLR